MSIEVKNYLSEAIEEELYASSDTIPASSTTPVKVAGGTIISGYNAIAVSVACTQNANCSVYLKIGGKQYYPNGLNTAGLAGLTEETYLLVDIPEGKEWELGFTNTAGSAQTIAWRFRIRLFKK
jgi:hypothetical protein